MEDESIPEIKERLPREEKGKEVCGRKLPRRLFEFDSIKKERSPRKEIIRCIIMSTKRVITE